MHLGLIPYSLVFPFVWVFLLVFNYCDKDDLPQCPDLSNPGTFLDRERWLLYSDKSLRSLVKGRFCVPPFQLSHLLWACPSTECSPGKTPVKTKRLVNILLGNIKWIS